MVVVLICYEQRRITALVAVFHVDGSAIATVWPDDRLDVIWTLSLDPVSGRYAFGQLPQQLLDGDAGTVI
jgi:hypothetical protein